MESNDLHSASTYVNNLLLARGLLRDGKTIDFGRLAQPTERRKRKHQQLRFEDADEHGREKKEKGDDDTYKITTQVLNLVHDLILKRDVSRLVFSPSNLTKPPHHKINTKLIEDMK